MISHHYNANIYDLFRLLCYKSHITCYCLCSLYTTMHIHRNNNKYVTNLNTNIYIYNKYDLLVYTNINNYTFFESFEIFIIYYNLS